MLVRHGALVRQMKWIFAKIRMYQPNALKSNYHMGFRLLNQERIVLVAVLWLLGG